MLMTRGCGCDGSVSALRNRRLRRSGITQAREHEVDRGTGGIDGSVEVAPTALDTNVGFIDTPGRVGWFEMTAQPLLQFGTVALDPAPDCRVVRFQAALAEQLFDITERERIPKVPAHGAQNQLGLGLSPLKDRRSDCLLHDLFRVTSRRRLKLQHNRYRYSPILRAVPAVGAPPPPVDAPGPSRRREDLHRLLRQAADGRRPAHGRGPVSGALCGRARRQQLHLRRSDGDAATRGLGGRAYADGRVLWGHDHPVGAGPA